MGHHSNTISSLNKEMYENNKKHLKELIIDKVNKCENIKELEVMEFAVSNPRLIVETVKLIKELHKVVEDN